MLKINNTITPKENIITFGSIKEKELEIILPVIISLKNDLQDILIYIAPREIHLSAIIEDRLSKSFNVARLSAIKKRVKEEVDIVVVDTMGDLMGIYEKSKLAFVGGSLAPYGGQNILEPLFFATPVIFGPHMENFKDIADMVLSHKAGIMVQSGDDLYTGIKSILSDDSIQKEMGNAGKTIIQQQQNVMKRTVDVILKAIDMSDGRRENRGGLDQREK
jgi:3-deoxy-D-manno-octulosonic-acid transferase